MSVKKPKLPRFPRRINWLPPVMRDCVFNATMTRIYIEDHLKYAKNEVSRIEAERLLAEAREQELIWARAMFKKMKYYPKAKFAVDKDIRDLFHEKKRKKRS